MDRNIQFALNPLVSIIIPVYNSEKHLAECIESALAQTWVNKEIILVDDGSTDNSCLVAEKYADRPKVQVIRQKNKGAAAARNTGLMAIKGEYVQFLDADDLLSPDKIEAQIATLNGSTTELAICKTVHFNDGESYLDGVQTNDWFCIDSHNPVDFLTKLYAGEEVLPGYGGMVTIHSWLTPRKLIDMAGPWNEKLSLDDDGEFFCRVILASEGIKFCDTGFNYYRKFNNKQSLSAQKSRKGMESAVLAIDLKLQHLKARTTELLVDRVFAKHYWWTGVMAYPQYKSLSKYCIQKAKQLGYSGERYVGGPGGHALAALLGWKMARMIAYYQQFFKRAWA
jgi:glycosyltransferase involved in cell wall biosynthesis